MDKAHHYSWLACRRKHQRGCALFKLLDARRACEAGSAEACELADKLTAQKEACEGGDRSACEAFSKMVKE
jgi:hypothetical protein